MGFGRFNMGRGFGTLGVLGTASSYLGPVATAGRIPADFTATSTMMMSASEHIMRDSVSSIKIRIPNSYVAQANGVETALGSPTTLTASLEYPLNTGFQPLLFGGSATRVAQNTEPYVDTDFLANPPPEGATVRIRIFWQNASGIIYVADGWTATNGVRAEFGTSGITDKTMGGTIASPGGGVYFPPVAIIGMTRKKTIFIPGDSRQAGVADTGDASTDVGEIARCIGPDAGYISAGIAGDRAMWAKANYGALRLDAAALCSDIISGYGRNDIYVAGNNLATLQADHLALLAQFPSSKRKYLTTIVPDTTGTFDTVAGQSVVPVRESIRTAYNAWVRAGGIAGVRRTFDLASTIEVNSSGVLTTDGGFWNAPGFTGDGIHELQLGNLGIKNSGALTVAMLG